MTARGAVPPVASRAVHAIGLPEGRIAEGLATIQARFPALAIGSYPYYRAGGNGVAIVAKGTDETALDAAIDEAVRLIATQGVAPVRGEPEAP